MNENNHRQVKGQQPRLVIRPRVKARFIFAWYDVWVGLFWDSGKRRLYIFPVPCVGMVLEFRGPDNR